MSYTKQTHVAGQKLTAAQLNYMENGIVAAQNAYNLLDNSDFRNPVNQRGATSYGGTAGIYTIDRWKAPNANITVQVNSGYISVTNADTTSARTIQQFTTAFADYNGPITAAVGLKDGTILCGSCINDSTATSGSQYLWTISGNNSNIGALWYSTTNGYKSLGLNVASNATVDIVWAALYKGEYTAETLPAYVPKGYGAELAECQRYLRVLPESTLIFSSVLQNGLYNTNSIYFDRLRDNITPSVSWLDYFTAGGDGAFGIIQGVSYVTINDVTAMVYPDRIHFTTTKSYGGHAFEIKRCLLSAEL